jgi:hypothetical protein
VQTPFREPQIEEGQRNIILQNRCGNRLTLLLHPTHTDLEWVYKPNAFRRKEFRARNFSNRDNFTTLFAQFTWPDIHAGNVTEYDYDPFVTRLTMHTPTQARNRITLVNIPDENCFAIAARQPLLIVIKPHERFVATDGLLTETFVDRGETITSFMKFPSFEANRYRVLDDGRHVLQILENEILLVGGEENEYQVRRVCACLGHLDLPALVAHTEKVIAPTLAHGRLNLPNDKQLESTLELNRRFTWSGLDEGGACFGAVNRIYHLIWTRDGAMTAAAFARAGMPDLARIWTPFLLANPSEVRDEAGTLRREFLQLVGTRWTKAEDDGVYYAVLSLFTLVHTTGDDALLCDGTLERLLESLDTAIATRFDQAECLFGSDTLGEDALVDSPYFGYDVVNGQMVRSHHTAQGSGPAIRRAYSLYQNMNMYNCLCMACALIDTRGGGALHPARSRYAALATQLADALAARFVNESGCYRAMQVVMDDNTRRWHDFAPSSDFWEYSWAVSSGPFFPDPVVALRSVRLALRVWPTVRNYGFCPWNFLARAAKEYGLDSQAYRELLKDELAEANLLTTKYPMRGLLTEYLHDVEGWRGLPFSTGSLVLSVCGLLLQPLPLGLALRASTLVDAIESFHYRTARLRVTATGRGDHVASVQLNGAALLGTLQIPESRLRNGPNSIEVVRSATGVQTPRLYSSTAILRDCANRDGTCVFQFAAPVAPQLVFEALGDASVEVTDAADRRLEVRRRALPDAALTIVYIDAAGDLTVKVTHSSSS